MVLLRTHEPLRRLPKQLEFIWLQVTENLATGGLNIKELLSHVTERLETGILRLVYTYLGDIIQYPWAADLCQTWQVNFHPQDWLFNVRRWLHQTQDSYLYKEMSESQMETQFLPLCIFTRRKAFPISTPEEHLPYSFGYNCGTCSSLINIGLRFGGCNKHPKVEMA